MKNKKNYKSLQDLGILKEVKLPNGKIDSIGDIKNPNNSQVFENFEDFVIKIKSNKVILRIDEIFTRKWGISPSNKYLSRYILIFLPISINLLVLATIIIAFTSQKYFLLFFAIPIGLMGIRKMWLLSVLGLIIYYILYQQIPIVVLFLIWSKIAYFLMYDIPLRALTKEIINNQNICCNYLNNGIIALSFPKEKKWLSIKNGIIEWWNQDFFESIKK